MSRKYTREERYKPIFDANACMLNLGGKSHPLFLGFDSGAPGGEVADRIGQYVDWCGRRAIAMASQGADLPPFVIIVTLRADASIPAEVTQTVREGGRSCRVKAQVIRLATMSLDDLEERNWQMFLPFYFTRFEERYPEMEADPGKRGELLEDARRAIRMLNGPLPYQETAGQLLSTMREILETETADYPRLREEIRKLFEDE